MDSSSSPQNQTPVRNQSFYFDDDPMVIFQVENELFKVHRHFFTQGSEIFRDMFSGAMSEKPATTLAEGRSDEDPIVLPEVTVKEFRTLLRLFYAMASPIPDKITLSGTLTLEQDEKLAVLSIAHRFVFDKVFEYICGQIEPHDIPVVDRIRLGDKYCLNEWLRSAYKTILGRTPNEKMSPEEADALGLERAVRILETRYLILHDACLATRPVNHEVFCACNRRWSCSCCVRYLGNLATIPPAVEKHSATLSSTVDLLD